MRDYGRQRMHIVAFMFITAMLALQANAHPTDGESTPEDLVVKITLLFVAALLGACFTWFQTRESKIHDSKAKDCDYALKDIWTLTSKLPLRPIDFDFSYKDLESLSSELKTWYFTYGHLISKTCQKHFIRLQDIAIRSVRDYIDNVIPDPAINKDKLETPLHPLVYIHCQTHCSLLRGALSSHFETRRFWNILPAIRMFSWLTYGFKYRSQYHKGVQMFVAQTPSAPHSYPWIKDIAKLKTEPNKRSEIQNGIDRINKIREDRRKKALHLDDLHLKSKKRK